MSLFDGIQFAIFLAVAKVNYQTNQQPNGEINPVPNT
jgi:hypothetical protein